MKNSIRPSSDALLDEIEMVLDDYGVAVMQAVRAWGYSDRVAWSAAAAARDGVLAILEAEDGRLHRLEVHRAAIRIGEALPHG